MANSLVVSAATLFLLLLTLTTADADSDLVIDVEGNPLEVGSEYFISPAIGFYGMIGRAPRGAPCPLYVAAQPPTGGVEVVPVKFVPVNETLKEIHFSSDFQIDSGRSAHCRSDGFWRVRFDPDTRGDVVIAAGAFGVPRSLFRIENPGGAPVFNRIAYSPPTATSSLQQRYLTLYFDPRSRLTLVRPTNGSAAGADLFVFFKNKKDVVASI